MSFKRTPEDFVCARCGFTVKGTGYTNHCPKCLWSRHVDLEPGDRAARCGGMMEPVGIEGSSPEYGIVHICRKCSATRRNKVQREDNTEAVLALTRSSARAS